MRKIISLALIGMCMIGNARAEKWRHTNDDKCWLKTVGNVEKWEYYYCGDQNRSCAGLAMIAAQTANWLKSGEYFDKDGTKMWCCGGYLPQKMTYDRQASGKGRFVAGDEWIVKSEVKVKKLDDNHTCTWVQKTNICGTTEGTACTKPDPCPDGQVEFNNTGKCVTPCGAGYLFESQDSPNCVKCPQTIHQGPSAKYDYCVKCDERTQFYSFADKACIDKSKMNAYDNQLMKKCFACPNREVFKKCIDLFNRTADEAKNSNEYKTIIEECLIDD